jgi:hypothetical protein
LIRIKGRDERCAGRSDAAQAAAPAERNPALRKIDRIA